MDDKKDTLSITSIILHWYIGVSMIVLLSIGWYMEAYNVYGLFDIHKSLGILVFVVIIFRVIWRLKKGWPKALNTKHKLELLLAKITHWGLLITTVLFPLSGMMMSGGGGHGLEVFGLELLAQNTDIESGRSIPLHKDISSLGAQLHGTLLWIILVLLAFHILGVIKHHFWYKDRTLVRMLGK